jgi:hypothetical protein
MFLKIELNSRASSRERLAHLLRTHDSTLMNCRSDALRSDASLRALYRHPLRGLLAAACTVLVGIVMEQAATAQPRPPIKRISSAPAYRVRDIEQGSDKRSFSMATPARLGNFLTRIIHE